MGATSVEAPTVATRPAWRRDAPYRACPCDTPRRREGPVMPPAPLRHLTADELQQLVAATMTHYESTAPGFWEGTKDHDVSQNIDALLRHLPAPAPCTLLDLGCGP